MEYGLIGKKLAHSFSGQIHNAFGRYQYEMKELTEQQLEPFFADSSFKGINVTIPYKERVIPYCDEIDPHAKQIGAVNTIVNLNGKRLGYNTDYKGFAYLLQKHTVDLAEKKVLILGNGGTTKTVHAVAQDRGAREILVASRNQGQGTISYQAAAKQKDVQIVINASPAGMYPDNGTCYVDLAVYPALEAVIDAVCNPLRTQLLLQAEILGIRAINGLEMLVAQAKYAADYFLQESLPEQEIERIYTVLLHQFSNISLIGMPGCGKTSLGKQLATRVGKLFVDLDEEIEKQAGKPIPEIFAQDGEEAFRTLESQITAFYSAKTGQVLSTGGGIVTREENSSNLRQNGVILFIDCPVDLLQMSDGRPLAKSREDLEKLMQQRYHSYQQAACKSMQYHTDFEENLNRLEQLAQKAIDERWQDKRIV